MAKTKSKSKTKFDIKDLMLKKGEYVVLGVAGLGLLLLLMGGFSTYSEAKDPKTIANGLTSKAKNIDAAVTREADPGAVPKLEDWAVPGAKGGSSYAAIPVKDFPLSGVMFDPTARPDTKRENPRVQGIGVYQVDLVRAPMKAHDIVYDPDGGAKIAVRVVKKQSDADKEKVKKALEALKNKGSIGNKAFKAAAQPQPQPGTQPGVAPPPGIGPMGGRGPMGGPPPGMTGPGGGSPGEGGFSQTGFRVETTINYIPLEDLDKAAGEGKLPAMTVVPLRMAVVNATFPFKAQAEEMKRALRMKTAGEAAPFVKFDGFDVKRRVTAPDGTVVGTGKKYAELVTNAKDDAAVGWYDYRYIDKYQELIASRMLNSHVEGADPKDKSGIGPYLPYFYRYEDNLVMFLPELVPELGQYPEVKLAPILETVQKMKDALTPAVTKSELIKRLTPKGKDGDSPRTGIFLPTNASASPGLGSIYGSAAGGYGMPPPGGKGEGGEGGSGQAAPAGVEIDNILIRFIDPDVRPGYTYEYMMRVRLINPNFGNPKSMSNPVLATDPRYRVLEGPWTRLTQSLTVPAESYVFAYDPVKYDEEAKAAYTKGPLLKHFELPPGNTHTVVQKLTWLEQVRVDQGNQREPVGAWVAAEMPVPRGGFVGRKTYVKLPLWSSEENRYTLREAQAMKLGKGKDAAAPKGWMVDFSGRDVLVDFDGGKVTTKVGSKTVIEDVATELLIVRPDGRLTVRTSGADMGNPERVKDTAEWARWQRDVEAGVANTGTGTGGTSPFGRPPVKD
jgi:hypothetical protein